MTMPIDPVRDYDGARYPTLDEVAAERRAFLRQIGLAAIAAALGPSAVACEAGNTGGEPPVTGKPKTRPTPEMPQLAGAIAPPRWPGPRGALIGGSPIEVTWADGSKGWVAVAAVFRPDNAALEGALIDAEAKVAEAVRALLKQSPPTLLGDQKEVDKVEAALFVSLQKIVAVPGLQSIAVARAGPARVVVPRALKVAPAAPRAAAPAAAAPAMAPPPATAVPAMRRLPRAGAKCPIHGEGCTASEHGT
jgi:hypothetical protein